MVKAELTLQPVFVGRDADDVFEEPTQVMWIFESQFIGNLTDGFIATDQQLLSAVDGGLLYIFLCRSPGLFFDQVAEIVGRQMQLVGTPGDRRQAGQLGLIRCKIVAQQLLEASQQIFVYDFMRHELSVEKTNTVVEQNFDIGCNDLFRVFVDGIVFMG